MRVAPMLIPLALCASVGAFAPSQSSLRHTRIPGPLSAFEDPGEASVAEETIDKPAVLPMKRSGTVMSESIPFLRCPAVLVDCDLAGNVGFDPLGLAKNKELLMEYREAEIKHARLAMLAAAGWPISELLDRSIAEFFGVPSILDQTDRVPSLLNGGLEQVSPVWWGTCLGLSAAIDMYGVSKSRAGDPTYFPGKIGFDPLGLNPDDEKGRKKMELAEIKHGRLAMIAFSGFGLQEYVSKLGVVDETPFFFYPITETLRNMYG